MRGLRGLFLAIACGAGLGAWPAIGQVPQAIATSGLSERGENELRHDEASPPAEDGAKKDKKANITVSATFAPSLTGSLPLEEGDRLTDFQSSGLAVKWTVPLDEKHKGGWSWSFVAGAKRNIEVHTDKEDEDGDGIFDDPRDPAASSLYLSSSVEWKRGHKRLSPFAGVTLERGYTGIGDDRSFTDKRVAAGVKLPVFGQVYLKPCETPAPAACAGDQALSLTLIGSVERTFSSDRSRARVTPQAKADLAVHLGSGIDWNVAATAERRLFDRVGGARRKDWRVLAFAGLDFAKMASKAINAASERERAQKKVFDELKIGVRASLIESNDDLRDDLDFELLPTITIGTSF